MRRNVFALLLLAAFIFQTAAFAQAPAVKISAAEKQMLESVTAKQLSDYLHFVASDEMEGRDTPSRGLDLTAKFIATNLSRWGLKPAGDNGTFFQKIALDRQVVDVEKTMLQINGQAMKPGDDFLRLRGNRAVTAPMVFGSHGWLVKSKGVDAYQGVDVKGKIVVLYSSQFNPSTFTAAPEGVSEADMTGTKGVDWADPLSYAAQSGAVGIIAIAPPSFQANWNNLKNYFSGGGLYPQKLRPSAAAGSDLPILLVSQSAGDKILAGESADRSSVTPFAINKTANMAAVSKNDVVWTQNVVALWEGSDPTLKSEMVAIGAHYDHDGIKLTAKGEDKIYNGADDDGSGTVAVLAIAEALANSPVRPKRSVLFVWHCGEEKGLWGSEYFNKFPTVDIKNVVAQLNIDMIGRSRKPDDTNPKNKELTTENEIYVIGSEMMSSTLGAVTKGANSAYLNLSYNYLYDDPKDTNRFFFRSDHFNYAMNGIPIVFWFDGVHEDYHQPGDHPDKIDYAKMERVTRTILLTLLELTDLKERPKVDKQLPPELRK